MTYSYCKRFMSIVHGAGHYAANLADVLADRFSGNDVRELLEAVGPDKRL